MSNDSPATMATCPTTGLPVCRRALGFVKVHAVLAVVFLLMGAIAGLLMALTRWPQVHLLPATWFYRILTFHGLNMLVFWIISMEVAILYFVATSVLRRPLFSRGMAWLTLLLCVAGAFLTDWTILTGRGDVLMTSYVPLKADPKFYLGLILFAVGALLAVFNFIATLLCARKEGTYGESMPLVGFGTFTAAIIAIFTILHGAAVLIPTWMWSMGWIGGVDASLYRLLWWGFGHASQQINVAAMVSVWYLLATLTVGARPVNQAVCRTAFLLYIVFINVASAHHLLVDPAVTTSWKIWNTSYIMYLAVLASMIHGFTVPASVEVAMRKRGFDRGIFGWLANAPWKDPGFSAFFLSLVIFGFIGGITGVTLGTQQINIIAHNTLRLPGHFHGTVVGGTTLAFMGLAYYVIPMVFQRDFRFRALARIQPYLFAAGVTLMAISMSFAGSFGVPRRHWDVEFTGSSVAVGFPSAAHVWLGLVGIAGVLMFLGALIFILLAVVAVFFGPSNAGRPMTPWQDEETARQLREMNRVDLVESESVHGRMPGTVVLTLILLLSFAVYYFANWKALSDVWPVR